MGYQVVGEVQFGVEFYRDVQVVCVVGDPELEYINPGFSCRRIREGLGAGPIVEQSIHQNRRGLA